MYLKKKLKMTFKDIFNSCFHEILLISRNNFITIHHHKISILFVFTSNKIMSTTNSTSSTIISVDQAANDILTMIFDLEKIGQNTTPESIVNIMNRYDATFLAELSARFLGPYHRKIQCP